MITRAPVLKLLLGILLILAAILIRLQVDYHDRIARERAELAVQVGAKNAAAIQRHNQAVDTQRDLQTLDKLKCVFGTPRSFGGIKDNNQ
jgi:hypothetical protein